MSGGFLPLKPKARAPVKTVLAGYQESELPAQASEKSSLSRIKTLTRLLGELTLADLTVEVLEEFERIRMGSARGRTKCNDAGPPRERAATPLSREAWGLRRVPLEAASATSGKRFESTVRTLITAVLVAAK
jgi:hypothetical protein